jgi:hypothetical protein
MLAHANVNINLIDQSSTTSSVPYSKHLPGLRSQITSNSTLAAAAEVVG